MFRKNRVGVILLGATVTGLVGSSMAGATSNFSNISTLDEKTKEEINKILKDATKGQSDTWKCLAIITICLLVVAFCVEELRIARSKDKVELKEKDVTALKDTIMVMTEKGKEAQIELAKMQKEYEDKIKKLEEERDELRKNVGSENVKLKKIEYDIAKEKTKQEEVKAGAEKAKAAMNLMANIVENGVNAAELVFEYTVGLPLKFKAGCITAATNAIGGICNAVGSVSGGIGSFLGGFVKSFSKKGRNNKADTQALVSLENVE